MLQTILVAFRASLNLGEYLEICQRIAVTRMYVISFHSGVVNHGLFLAHLGT
jgi:hypothetical protein